jgi:hypothetical protein
LEDTAVMDENGNEHATETQKETMETAVSREQFTATDMMKMQ